MEMRFLFFSLSLVVLTYLYLYPGSDALFQRDTKTVMSDGTDPTSLPFAYDSIIQTWKTNPTRFFYGTVYVDRGNPEKGIAQWMPWSERWLVLFASNFFPLEQLSTALVFSLLIINGVCMSLLGRYLKWGPWVSSAIGIAWAFCPFTRARAQVHMAMAGTYHLPLIFLGLFLVVRGRSWSSAVLAALCFLLAATTVHYFIITAAFLVPFYILFIGLQPEIQSFWRAHWRRFLIRLGASVLPVVIFLGLNYSYPVPSDVKMSASESFPTSGAVASGQTHPFLIFYSAQPIDYLTGDLALDHSFSANPAVENLSQYVQKNMTVGNNHERTNGIRWIFLFIAALSLLALITKKYSDQKTVGSNIIFFFLFGAFAFWLSMSPDVPLPGWGPSGWLHSLVSQIRVPSRAGIIVHFSVLMMVGFFLSARFTSPRWKYKNYLLIPGLLPFLAIAEYLPLAQTPPMAHVRSIFPELQREQGPCGAGFFFPFVSAYMDDQSFYGFLQQMRGSDCQILNTMSTIPRLQNMTNRFPPSTNFINNLGGLNSLPNQIKSLSECVPLSWIVFSNDLPKSWTLNLCDYLGWKLHNNNLCLRPQKDLPLRKFPDECL